MREFEQGTSGVSVTPDTASGETRADDQAGIVPRRCLRCEVQQVAAVTAGFVAGVDDETIEYVWAVRKTGIEAKRTAAFGIEILSLAAGRVGVLENLDRFGIVSDRFKWMEGVAAVADRSRDRRRCAMSWWSLAAPLPA